jgi:hypothetical protein
VNLGSRAPIWPVVGDLSCPSCRRVSWDRSDGRAVVALAFGEIVVLVDDDWPGPATWICGHCGVPVEASSPLAEQLDLQAYGVPAEGE